MDTPTSVRVRDWGAVADRKETLATIVKKIRLVLALALLAVASNASAVDAYPAAPIRIIVPQEPGGTVDTVTRYFANRLEATIGSAVVVENRSGASGAIGAEFVARAAPDGYALLAASTNTQAMVPHVLRSVRYDPLRDFVPAVNIASTTTVVLVAPTLPVRSLNELAALLAGDVSVLVLTSASALPYVQSGKANALAVSGGQRLAAFPGVLTTAEAGFPAFDVRLWVGLLAPARTPPDVVAWLNREVNRLLREPEVTQWLVASLHQPVGGTPPDFAATMRADHTRWAEVVASAKIAAQ